MRLCEHRHATVVLTEHPTFMRLLHQRPDLLDGQLDAGVEPIAGHVAEQARRNCRATGFASRPCSRSMLHTRSLPEATRASNTRPSLRLVNQSSMTWTVGRSFRGRSSRISASARVTRYHHCPLLCAVGGEAGQGGDAPGRRGSPACAAAGGSSRRCSRRSTRTRGRPCPGDRHAPGRGDQEQDPTAGLEGRPGRVVEPVGDGHARRRRSLGRGRIDPNVPVVLVRRSFQADGQPVSRGGEDAAERDFDGAERDPVVDRDRPRGHTARGDGLAIVARELPYGRCISEGLGAEVGHLERGVERLIRREHPPRQPSQRHRAAAEAAELAGRDVALGVPEGVEHAHQRRALAGEVVAGPAAEARPCPASAGPTRSPPCSTAPGACPRRSGSRAPGRPIPWASRDSRKISKFLGLSRPVYLCISAKFGIDAPLPISWLITGTPAGPDVFAVIGHRLGAAGR